MLSFFPVEETAAHTVWNNFTRQQLSPVPYSFNPSLFSFFRRHFHWKPYYLFFYRNDKLAGILPLVDTGKAWASLPHFSYGGILTNQETAFPEQKESIASAADTIKKKQLPPGFYRCDIAPAKAINTEKKDIKLFVRTLDNPQDSRFEKSEKITRILKIDKNEVSLFGSLNANLRRKIRKGDKNNLSIQTGGMDLLHDFYFVYAKNIHHLHSLNYGRRFFKDLFQSWQYGDFLFFVAYRNGNPVGSALLLSYGNFYENIFFATLPEKRKFYVSDWMHWQMIKYVLEKREALNEKTYYSFGRSTQFSSVHKYKSHWPATDIQLYIYSDINDYRNRKGLQQLWKFLPFWVTHPLGSRLVKEFY